MDNVAQALSKFRSKFELSKPAISRYVEHDALRLQRVVSVCNLDFSESE